MSLEPLSDAPATYDLGGRELTEQKQTPMYTQLADWERSDQYHNSFLIKQDQDLIYALERSRSEGLPDIGMQHAAPFVLLG